MTTEYRRYFDQHPRGTRLFGPSYSQFLVTACFHDIPAAKAFLDRLSRKLDKNVEQHMAKSEARILECAEETVCEFYQQNGFPVTQYSGGMYPRLQRTPSTEVAPVRDECCPCKLV